MELITIEFKMGCACDTQSFCSKGSSKEARQPFSLVSTAGEEGDGKGPRSPPQQIPPHLVPPTIQQGPTWSPTPAWCNNLSAIGTSSIMHEQSSKFPLTVSYVCYQIHISSGVRGQRGDRRVGMGVGGGGRETLVEASKRRRVGLASCQKVRLLALVRP